MKKLHWFRLAIVSVLMVLMGALSGCGGQQQSAQPGDASAGAPFSQPADTPQASTPAPATPSAASPSESKGNSCTTTTGQMHKPKQLKIDRLGVTSPVITVGKDESGNPGSPPKSERNMTAWYDRSPEVGSDKGNTILTIHTYSPKNGANALGNKLYSKDGLKEGDIIRIIGDDGQQACYKYTGNRKVFVKDYDPKSGIFHNLEGPPQLAIMICWDYNSSTNDWDSRVIFYASFEKI